MRSRSWQTFSSPYDEFVSTVTTASAQEKPEEKPAKPTAPPSQPKLGTELDGPVVVNTDLITVTVTVTDTYGRYVSGLSKNAFTILDITTSQRCSLIIILQQ